MHTTGDDIAPLWASDRAPLVIDREVVATVQEFLSWRWRLSDIKVSVFACVLWLIWFLVSEFWYQSPVWLWLVSLRAPHPEDNGCAHQLAC